MLTSITSSNKTRISSRFCGPAASPWIVSEWRQSPWMTCPCAKRGGKFCTDGQCFVRHLSLLENLLLKFYCRRNTLKNLLEKFYWKTFLGEKVLKKFYCRIFCCRNVTVEKKFYWRKFTAESLLENMYWRSFTGEVEDHACFSIFLQKLVYIL